MADSPGTVAGLAVEVGRALTGLEGMLTPVNLPRLLVELGLDDPPDLSGSPGFVAALADVADQAAGLAPAVAAVADGAGGDTVAQAQAVGELLDGIRRVIIALRSLADALEQATAGSPDAAELAGFAATFAERLLGAAVVTYLDIEHPFLRRVLSLLTLVEMEAAAQTDQSELVPLLRRRLHPERVGRWIGDPLAVLRDGYGWGQDSFDGKLLFRNVRDLFDVLVPLAIARDADEITPAALDFYSFLVEATTDAMPPGLEGGLYVDLPGPFDLTLGELSENVRAVVHVTAALPANSKLRLLPPASLEIPGDETATGMVALSLVGEAPDTGTPFLVFGAAGGTRLEAIHLSAALTATLAWDAAAGKARSDLGFEADVAGGRLVVDPSGFDGFLRSVLPADGIQAPFDFGLTWSAERGFAFRGAAGLEATVPVALSLGPVSVVAIHLSLQAHDSGVTAEVSAGVGAAIGPVQVAIDRLGVATVLAFPEGGGNVGIADLDIGFKAPSGLELAVDAGPVTGGGALVFDPDRGFYAGEMQLQFEPIAVRAVGLLTTGRSGYSLLVLVSAEFPPVQLGFGFMLAGVGGLLGIHRTVAVEALRAGLKAGALGAVLSPPDPKADPAQLVASLAGLFPQAAGRYVFAPTARIVWGSPALITIDLCLVLELPSPVRLVALGRMRALLPEERDPVVRLQVDVLGVIDFGQQTAAVDATLIDSRVAQFALTGDLALRMSWGPAPVFLLAVGGFHPRFAAPPGFPALDRVAVALASGDNPKLRLEAYLALTSNTVQFGARVDVGARAGSFSIGGFMAFDALVTLSPLAFVVDIAAKLAVKAGSHTLLSISLALTLSGPRPWHAHGRASFSILFFDVSFGFDITIGDPAPAALPNPVDVAPLLLAALADPRAWTAQLPAGADVVTLRTLDAGTAILAHPLATLQVRQRVAPLDRTLDRFGTGVPSGAARFRITLATVGGVRTTLTPLQDRFAAAQFTAMSDDQKLSAPSFEAMTSGAALGADGYATGAPVTVSVAYEQALVTAEDITPPSHQRLPLPLDVFATLTATTSVSAPIFALRDTA